MNLQTNYLPGLFTRLDKEKGVPVEKIVQEEFAKVFAELSPETYHVYKVDIRFPRGLQMVLYAEKNKMSAEEFQKAVKERLDEEWRELCSY